MSKITVDGKSYKVIETLAFQQVGMRAKAVQYDDNGTERVAVFDRGRWRWWTVEERVAPLLNGLVRHKL